jgi:hypothetical protein
MAAMQASESPRDSRSGAGFVSSLTLCPLQAPTAAFQARVLSRQLAKAKRSPSAVAVSLVRLAM